MSGGVEREDVFQAVEELRWTQKKPNKKGYIKLLCPCGKHKTWLHKTPSNPNYYRERVNFLRRCECSKGEDEPPQK
jgi:hypothetical protein